MVAIQAPQFEPAEWLEPEHDDHDGRRGLDAGRWPSDSAPRRPRALPDRATRIRRRRLAVLILVAVTALAVTALLRWTASSVVGSDDAPEPITAAEYVVQPGDTLWSIAERLAPGEDPRPIVAELRARHGDSELEVGDRLDVADLGQT